MLLFVVSAVNVDYYVLDGYLVISVDSYHLIFSVLMVLLDGISIVVERNLLEEHY